MCQAKIGGTAFPIALYADDVLVLKMKLSGKDCILAHSLTDSLLHPCLSR